MKKNDVKIDNRIMSEVDYETFVNVISNIPSCIFYKDLELKYRFSTKFWSQLISEDIIGKTDLEIRKDKENAALAMESDANIIKTGIGHKYVIKSEIDGVVQYLELNKEPVMDADGKVIGIVGLINDITEKTLADQRIAEMSKKLEDQLEELEASNDELLHTLTKVEHMNASQKMFTASMNHELRSPLNGIIGILQILYDDRSLNIAQHDYVVNAYHSSQLMLEIVNDLLDHAKMETSEFSIRNDVFDIKSMLSGIAQTAKVMASSKRLEFYLTISDSVADKYIGDENRITQIINNLLSNGIKYTDTGKVTLTVDYEDGNLLFTCSDTGQGISEESQKILFDPFVRLNEKKNSGIQGTGLGLSIVEKIIERMNGDIVVNSQVNKGTDFVVRIPLEVFAESEDGLKYKSVLELKEGEIPDFSKLSVLCVDDTRVNLIVFEGLLKDTGIKIDKAVNGLDAIEKANKKKYDIIFMDHMMTGINGVDTFKEIRKSSRKNKKTPVVIMTANVGAEYEKEYAEIGFDGYIGKPVMKTQLWHIINGVQ